MQYVGAIVSGLLTYLLISLTGWLESDNVVIGAEHAHQRWHSPFDHLHQLFTDDLGSPIHIRRREYASGVSNVEGVRLGSIGRQLIIDTYALGALIIDHSAQLRVGHG